MPPDHVLALLEQGTAKLRAERNGRAAPFVDTTLYTSLNGMFITSFLKAYRVLGDGRLRDVALAGLDRILRERTAAIRWSAFPASRRADDHVFLVEALIAAYEATGDLARRDRAAELMDGPSRSSEIPQAASSTRRPTCSACGSRASRTFPIPRRTPSPSRSSSNCPDNGDGRYRAAAERALRMFSGAAGGMGIHAGDLRLRARCMVHDAHAHGRG